MRFECYQNWSDLPVSADLLFEHCSKSSLFLSRQWFETLYETAFEEGRTLLLPCVLDGDRVLALLPIVHCNDRHYQSFIHRYSAFYSPLLAQEKRESSLACLVEGFRSLSLSSILLTPVEEGAGNTLDFRQSMESSGFICHQHFKFYNWVYHTDGQSFEEYMAQRPTQLRNTIARKRRKLEREHDFEITMYRGSEVRDALSDYHAAYSASWKAYEQYGTLLDALAVNLSVPDWTRLAVLYIDGEPAAAQLWFVVHGKASIFRLAYDERWKKYSTGSILTAWLMQYVIDTDKVQEIDFLTGNEPYKQAWMSERRQRWSMTFVSEEKQPDGFRTKVTRLMNRIRKSSS